MTDLIQRFFTPTAQSIREFYQQPGIGYFIPPYQREYSWSKDNIDQLMEDIIQGVEMLLTDASTIRFMGTVILVRENNPDANIKKSEARARPGTIFNVIDGQQRISTFALLACLLHRRLGEEVKKLPRNGWFGELWDEVGLHQDHLQEMFSFDLKLGKPKRKPIVIRSEDGWTVSGNEGQQYLSDVTAYTAGVIRAIDDGQAFPNPPSNSVVGDVLRLMDDWLDKVAWAHEPHKFKLKHQEKDDFLPAWDLLNAMIQRDPRSFGWQEMKDVVNGRSSPMTPVESGVCGIIQLFTFCHFLLERCCFTSIMPISEENAFDMFQSLNATGTPLTALETFKPLVVSQAADDEGSYQGSKPEQDFVVIERVFDTRPTFPEKTKLTNEFLNTFSLVQEGKGLPNQFSKQRRWLRNQYEQCDAPAKREEFMHRMADLAAYWECILGYDPSTTVALPGTETVVDPARKEAALSVLYLNEANHARANTVLSRFYALVRRGVPNADGEFVAACRAVAAFYTLWRAAYANTGLDAVYERLLESEMAWKHGNVHLTSANLKAHLRTELGTKGIGNKADWMRRATQELRYDLARPVSKMALFVSAHDTITDVAAPGLMKVGVPNTYPYLDPAKWRSKDLRSIEHIAPQKPETNSTWDLDIYQNGDEQRIGNLTLLPTEINSAAGNKQWVQKWIYYKHLAEKDPANLQLLEQQAQQRGFTLKDSVRRLLQNAGHNHHVEPITMIGANGNWDRTIITQRTERICNILWDRIFPWLS